MSDSAASAATYRTIPILDLDGDDLLALSKEMKLSLSREDMLAAQQYFADAGREPTDVELEVVAQTWSEHCKHRVFGALITHETAAGTETVDSLFKTYIAAPTFAIMEERPGFVLSCFHDNAGFIPLDDKLAVCLKAETHNHPSAIEPYAGANTGLGGVIRDILGAGKGSKPVASLDVFCFGSPETDPADIAGEDVIHPIGVLRGVVRGVRDYGNRMGIPTITGALQFDPAYIYNPLVFCGTAGIIPIEDIPKEIKPGMLVMAAGGRTGKDGLHGATFSSASLTTDSHAEDQQAVQIGNPIEEKKVADFILSAREKGWIQCITDCGAGGFSSATGEMLEVVGGTVWLDRCPVKEEGMLSWELFVSESQERMVFAILPEDLDEVLALAKIYETECVQIGEADGSGILKVEHAGNMVCELECGKLHDAPRRKMNASWTPPAFRNDHDWSLAESESPLTELLSDFAICSREAIIREYDHEVQGHTILKPLAGATGDAPQDGSAFSVSGSENSVAMAVALLPEWGKTAPLEMGIACVDECVRQMVIAGADPGQIAILDNFCVGNPDEPEILGALVETCKGISDAAVAYGAPFVSGKDSFYNYFETEDGPVSIPTTILVSGMGIILKGSIIPGSSLRRTNSKIAVLGETTGLMGGSVWARLRGVADAEVPGLDCDAAMERYRAFAKARDTGGILAAHDASEGGLGVAFAELGFSEVGGLDIDIGKIPVDSDKHGTTQILFSEAPGRIVLEIAADQVDEVAAYFEGMPFAIVGESNDGSDLHFWNSNTGDQTIGKPEPIAQLKESWKNRLTPYC